MTETILSHPLMSDMLEDIAAVFRKFGLDFYLVGAVARDVHLNRIEEWRTLRRTKDIDIAVMLNSEEQFYEVKCALISSGNFTEHRSEPIKLFYKDELEIDVLPFGEIENLYYEVQLHKPRVYTIDVPGFAALYNATEPIKIGATNINICSIEGIIILKLFANDDNSSRTKDITDIEHLLSVYFDLNQLDIWDNYLAVMDIYETTDREYLQLVSAHVTGRKIKQLMASAPLLTERLERILSDRPHILWQAMFNGITDQA